jgi:hypothetical protein
MRANRLASIPAPSASTFMALPFDEKAIIAEKLALVGAKIIGHGAQ